MNILLKQWSITAAVIIISAALLSPFYWVYLPKGTRWISHGSGQTFDGGQVVREPAPLDYLPVFLREQGSVRL